MRIFRLHRPVATPIAACESPTFIATPSVPVEIKVNCNLRQKVRLTDPALGHPLPLLLNQTYPGRKKTRGERTVGDAFQLD